MDRKINNSFIEDNKAKILNRLDHLDVIVINKIKSYSEKLAELELHAEYLQKSFQGAKDLNKRIVLELENSIDQIEKALKDDGHN